MRSDHWTRAVVTGATGFIGRQMCATLSAAGTPVLAICRASSDPAVVRALAAFREVAVLSLDDADDPLHLGLRSTDVVFHLATYFRARHVTNDLVPMIRTNVEFSTKVADEAAMAGARFVNASTVWLHHGSAAYDPVSLYAATKRAFEDVLQYYVSVHGLRAVSLELCDIYGNGDRRGKLLSALIGAAWSGDQFPLSEGTQLIDLCHVDDAVQGLLVAADNASASGELVRRSLSGGEIMSIRELVSLVELVGGRPVQANWGAIPSRQREMHVPWALHPAPDGWRPQVPLRVGLERLFAAKAEEAS